MKTYYIDDFGMGQEEDAAYKVYNSEGKCVEWWMRTTRAGPYRNYAVLHRENGPAVEYEDGSEEWYLEGKLHRVDGPAIIDAVTGDADWCIKHEYIACFDDFQMASGCSDEDLIMLRLKWGEIR